MIYDVFVVTYQNYLYGDEYDEIKYVMENPVKIKGAFSTIQKAKHFIKNDINKEAIYMVGY